MVDNVVLNKVAVIERCVARVHEEYNLDPTNFASDFTRQDAAILNIQRACQAALDLANTVVRDHKIGIPQSARDVYTLMADHNIISTSLAATLKRMVGFRNVAVHDYQSLQAEIVQDVIANRLDDLLVFAQKMLEYSRRGS